LRPAGARRRRGDGQDLSCSRLCDLGDLLHAPPLGRYEKQRALTRAPEHAGEAAAVKVDRLQHLTTLADAHAPFVGNVAVAELHSPVDSGGQFEHLHCGVEQQKEHRDTAQDPQGLVGYVQRACSRRNEVGEYPV